MGGPGAYPFGLQLPRRMTDQTWPGSEHPAALAVRVPGPFTPLSVEVGSLLCSVSWPLVHLRGPSGDEMGCGLGVRWGPPLTEPAFQCSVGLAAVPSVTDMFRIVPTPGTCGSFPALSGPRTGTHFGAFPCSLFLGGHRHPFLSAERLTGLVPSSPGPGAAGRSQSHLA